jgi:hypothetical protein
MNRFLAASTLALALGAPVVAHADMDAAYGMHSAFVQMGMQMQDNLACHNGGAIHLDDYPLSDDEAEFRAANPDAAHKWAMEGVYFEQSHRRLCR